MPNPSPTGPITSFLNEAHRRLRRHIPSQDRTYTLKEAEAHLNEHADALVAEGLPGPEAETAAVASFDEAGNWARSIIDAFYGDRKSRIARRIALLGAVVWIGAIACICLQIPALERLPAPIVWGVPDFALALLVTVGSFRSRLFFPMSITAIGLAAAIVVFLVCGATTITAPRGGGAWTRAEMQYATKDDAETIAYTGADVRLLRLGLRTYAHGAPASVPPALRTPDGAYIVPGAGMEWLYRVPYFGQVRTSFKENLRQQEMPYATTRQAVEQMVAKLPYIAEPTAALAAKDWKTNAPARLNDDATFISLHRAQLQMLQQAEAAPWRFNLHFALLMMAAVLIASAIPLVVHLLFAWFGRGIYFLVRRKQNRLTAA